MWLKIHDTLLDHRKLRRTCKLLKISEVSLRGYLVTLWLNVLRHSPDGDLEDWSNEDIEHYAGWEGRSGVFVPALIKTAWVDVVDGNRVIHDWEEHSEKLHIARVRKQNRERQRKHRAKEKESPVSNELVTRDVTLDNDREERRGEDKRGHVKGEVVEVFDHYRSYHPRSHKKPSQRSKEYKKIEARLNEGYSVDDLKRAIDGCHQSPYHMGENENGRKYDTLELIVRDGSKVSMFMEVQSEPVIKGSRKKSARAIGNWLERGKRDE